MNNIKEYKSDVFSMLMEYPENALQVYNVLNGTEYTDPSIVEIVTLEKGIALNVWNDASFIVDYEMVISEHQSTYNPNMPLRSLFYYSATMKKRVKEQRLDIFGKKRIHIPCPTFVVFYNGQAKQPEFRIQKLSDMYEKQKDQPDLELICRTYNINPSYNEEMLSGCQVLRDYTSFIEKIREYAILEEELRNAIIKAMSYCIQHDILSEFLAKRGEEVLQVMILDCTYEKRTELMQEEIDQQRQKLEEQDQKLEEKDQKLEEQGQKLEEKDQKLEEQGQKLEEKDQKLEEQKQTIRELQKMVKELQLQIEK